MGFDEYDNYGSGLVKQERSDPLNCVGNRVSKMGVPSDNDKQKMLSFSSNDKPEVAGFISSDDVRLVSDKNGVAFPGPTSTNFKTCTGFGSGNMNGSLTGIRGPFTPAQWIELEHQAMIYKYFTANVPVPSNLLIPIKKAIQSAGFSGFAIGSFPSHSYGWGSFHLGFSGNNDPEPGRCRRTDGKKWRCSREAVPDQKYCERHINRGRHRSRKPVEGHTGQAASGAATCKVLPAMPAAISPLVTPVSGVPIGNAIVQHQVKGLQLAGFTNASTDPITKRLRDQQGHSVMPPTIPKHQSSYNESSISEFGIISNDALLNPSQKSSYLDCKSYDSLLDFNTQKNQDQYPVRHMMDNWPKDQSHCSTISSPKQLKSDWTQLSMSIPMSTDFSSSSSSPNHENVFVSTSPPRLSREFDPSQMRVGISSEYGDSMGGPLGEVLLNNNDNNNISNSMDTGERWDSSPQVGSSPTGVLHKSPFVSAANSNSGSPLGPL